MSLRVLRVVWGRLRTDWPFLFACWLLVATATTLVAAGALYADTVELGSVRRALAEADPANQSVLVRLTARATEVGSLDAAVRPVLAGAFDDAGADVVLTARSASLEPAAGGQPGLDASKHAAQQLIVLGAYQDVDRHASLSAGRWPVAGKQPMEAAVSEKAAAVLGVQLGSRLQLADAATPGADPTAVTADVQIVGIWHPDQLSDPYWLGDPLDLYGQTTGSTSIRGPLLVANDDLAMSATAAGLDLRWRALPIVENIALNRIDAIRADVSQLPAALQAVLPAGRNVTVNTKLADVLGTIDRSVAVSGSGVVLVILQFVLLAGYAVLLAGALLVERRRAEVALLRARGARPSQVGLLAVAESLAIALPAALLAPFIALGVIELIGNVGAVGEAGIISTPSLSASVLAVTAIAGLACVLVVSLPALVSDVDLAHVRAAVGRPLGRTLAQRIGLDVVLLVVMAIGLYQLQSYGSPLARAANGQLSIDPVLVAAPALSLAAGALLVVRVVPRLGEIADRLLRPLRGLTVPLASSQIARQPLRYTRTALLVVLATALATFAATYTTTWADSQAAQAAYQAGADVRLAVNPQSAQAKPEIGDQLRAQPGVHVVTAVIRDRVDAGRQLSGVDALMLDAGLTAQQITLPPETIARGGATALAAIGGSSTGFAGFDLPAGTRRVGVVLDLALNSDIPSFPGQLQPSPGEGISVDGELEVGDQIVHVGGVAAAFAATGLRVPLALPVGPQESAVPASPLRLLSVQLRSQAFNELIGEITLVRLDASPSDTGDTDWATVANATDLPGWSFAGDGNKLEFTTDQPLIPVDSFLARRPQIFRFGPAQGAPAELRILASDAFLGQSGSKVGDVVTLTYHTAAFQSRIAGAVPNFPSLDPQKPFVVFDRASVRLAANDLGIADPPTNEWWLWVDPGAADDVAAALAQPPLSFATVVSQARLRQSLERDPVALGLIGALLLGSLAAAVCAAIGLVVGAIVSTRERATETALLRALGLSRRGVTAGVAIDNGYLLCFGLPAGIGLGVVLGWLVLPHTPLNRTGLQVVPAPQVVVPPEALAGLAIIGLLLLVVTVVAASRAANRAGIADVLRATQP